MTDFKEIASKPPLAMPQSVSAGLNQKTFYFSKLACFSSTSALSARLEAYLLHPCNEILG